MANTFRLGSQPRMNVIRPTGPIRQVVITPLSSGVRAPQGPRLRQSCTISKLLIKAVERNDAKGKKDKGKTFTFEGSKLVGIADMYTAKD